MAMLDQDLKIEEFASTVFLAEHICSRNSFELDPSVFTEQAILLMLLYRLDQAPVAGSGEAGSNCPRCRAAALTDS